MATIFVDNIPYQVPDGQNLLQACLTLGLDLPYFCWHPAMHSVGACRQCAVKQFRDENDTRGRIVMACMTPASEGTRISVDDPGAKAFRASVIEWLMESHPHDCPVCDEGGECHLQDMTLMSGHVERRYRFKKRTHVNQYLGPFVNHEMNRCIECYRCVRYYRDYAGGRDLNVFSAHNNVYFGRQGDGVLESEFSGNLVEICPTGVFTDKTQQKHYSRKWDQQTAPSICVNCAVGCNTIPGERYGSIRRIRNRYNGEVNGYFLCDRGRYGYEFVNSSLRIRQPLVRSSADAVPEKVAKQDVLDRLSKLLFGGSQVIGIGSPRASLEANFALRQLVGPDNFYNGMSRQENRLLSTVLDLLRNGPAPSPSLEEVRRCDAVLVLGEDVTNVAPMLALALRQASRQQPMRTADRARIPRWDDAAVREIVGQAKGPFFVASVGETRLDDVATQTFHAAPGDLARLGFALAAALGAPVPAVQGLSRDESALVDAIATALKGAERPVVVAGTSLGSESLIRAAAAVAWALRAAGREAYLSYTVPECNSMGVAMMGGGALEDAFEAIRGGQPGTVVVMENDLYRHADASAVDEFLGGAAHLVVVEHMENATSLKAEVALPVGTFAEADGTLVSNEGRAQRFFQVFVPGQDIQESWRWLRDMAEVAGRSEVRGWRNLDDITAAMIAELPFFTPVAEIAPPASFREVGQKIPREPHRFSGRTAILANIDVSEPKPPDDPDSALAFTMEGYGGQPPSSLISRFWAPGWNSIQSLNKFQAEVGGPLRGGDPGRRLIQPAAGVASTASAQPPAAFRPREGEWLVVPMYHIFGSEELSIHTPGVAELAPAPYLALNAEEAGLMKLEEGQEVELLLGGVTRKLAVRLSSAIPVGVAGVPVGVPGMLGMQLPTTVQWRNQG